jgi:hypothetical protein
VDLNDLAYNIKRMLNLVSLEKLLAGLKASAASPA